MRKFLFSILFCGFFAFDAAAQVNPIQWAVSLDSDASFGATPNPFQNSMIKALTEVPPAAKETDAGDIVILGQFRGNLTLNRTVSGTPIQIPNRGEGDVFLARFNKHGYCKWVKSWGGPGNDGGGYVTIAANEAGENEIFLTLVHYGGIRIMQQTLGASEADGLVLKLDGDGNEIWYYPVARSEFDIMSGIAVHKDEVIAVNSYTLSGSGIVNFIGLSKVRGNLRWIKEYDGIGNDAVNEIMVSGDSIYFAGALSSAQIDGLTVTGTGGSRDVAIGILSMTDKKFKAITTFGSSESSERAINICKQGKNIFVSGSTIGSFRVNGTNYSGYGANDFVIIKADEACNIQSIKVIGGSAEDQAMGITVTDSFVVATGYIGGPISLDDRLVPAYAGSDAFVWVGNSELETKAYSVMGSTENRNDMLWSVIPVSGEAAYYVGGGYGNRLFDEDVLLLENSAGYNNPFFYKSGKLNDPNSISESLLPSVSVKIVPNPVTDNHFKIFNLSPQAEISFYDLTGKAVAVSAEPGSEGMEVKINDLPTGIYLLKISDKNTIFTEKIIVD